MDVWLGLRYQLTVTDNVFLMHSSCKFKVDESIIVFDSIWRIN